MKAMRLHAVSAEPDIAIYAEQVLLIFAVVFMVITRIKEFDAQKGIEPICSLLIYDQFATNLEKFRPWNQRT
ncbi:hypothetical protein OFM39_35935, partial [Escherichia coli]|nr:hypothetical protein [Escherichia coli]